MKTRRVSIALIQMRCDDSVRENLDRAVVNIAEAGHFGAKVVVLPELFLGPYFCQRPDDLTAFEEAESIPGPTTEVLSGAARSAGVILVGGSIFEKAPDGRFFNTTPVFDADGSLLGTYRKTHIPEDILYHEQHYFTPGDSGVQVFSTAVGKIAPLICYDQWYPEAARMATLQGAELLIYPTAIGMIDSDVEVNITGDWEGMWRAAQVGHAAVNNVFVAAVNRVGREGAITFWGGSFMAGPSGEVIRKGGPNEEIIVVEIDLARVAPLQAAWRFLANRRPDAYRPLTEPSGAG
jgi:N-carbamoylputrescine amidase